MRIGLLIVYKYNETKRDDDNELVDNNSYVNYISCSTQVMKYISHNMHKSDYINLLYYMVSPHA